MSVLERPDGARTWWTSESEGEPVLLVMGLAYPSDMWFRVAPVLARSHRVISVDNRAAGRTGDVPGPVETMADDVLAALDEAGESSAHVVRASTGALIGQELAPTSAQRGRSLVLACRHPGAAHAVRDPEPLALLPEPGGLTPGQAAEASIRYNDPVTTPRERIEEDWAFRLPLACPAQGYLAQPMGSSSWSGRKRLPSPRVPSSWSTARGTGWCP